jgi:type II secretory pathway component PulF
MILLLGFVYETNRLEPIDWFGMGLGPRGDFILYCVIVSILLAGAFVLIQGTLKGWFGEVPMRIARRIPLIGHTIEALSLSRLAWTLSMAENSGMSAGASAGIAL